MALKPYTGVGCVYMAPVNASGQRTGNFKQVGNAYPLSIKVSTKQQKQISRRCENPGQIVATKTEIDEITGNLTLKDWNAANLAWNLAGTSVAMTGSGGTISAESITAPAAGEYVELAHPANVSAVVVKDSNDATTYAAGTDYTVNSKLGLLTIIAGGGIAAGDTLHVNYTYAAETGYQVSIGSETLIRVAIRANLKNEYTGEEFNLELDSVVLSASSELNFISEPGSEGEDLQFDLSMETLAGNTSPGRINGIAM